MTDARRLALFFAVSAAALFATLAHGQSTSCTTFLSSAGSPVQMCYENGQWVGSSASSTQTTSSGDVSGAGGGAGGGGGGENPLSKLPLDKLTSLLGGSGGKPHPTCIAWVQMPKRPPPPPCFEPSPKGPVAGICQLSTLCLATSAPGLDGAMSSVSQQLSQMLQQIFQGGGGGGGAGDSGSFGTSGTTYGACVLNPATNTLSFVPCTDSTGALIFDSALSSSSNTDTGALSFDGAAPSSGIADTLAGLLGKGNSALGLLSGIANTPVSASNALEALIKSPQALQTPAAQKATSGGGGQYVSSQAERGSIVVNDGGAALVAVKRTYNTVTAGFVGVGSSSEASNTLVGRACSAGQWGVISFVFGSFFGDLCKSQGY